MQLRHHQDPGTCAITGCNTQTLLSTFLAQSHLTTHEGSLNLKGQLKNKHSERCFFLNVPWQPTFAADFQFAAVAWPPYLEVLRG